MTIPDGWLADCANDLKASVAFLTRLPVAGATPAAGADIARAAWAFPLAGVLVALIAAVVYAVAHKIGSPPWVAAALAVAATLAVTGCLHEDGLADTADGLGGGDTREHKLEIMRDSRVGAYGVCALTLSILLRVSAIASLGNPIVVLWTLIAAHGAARRLGVRRRPAVGRPRHHCERAGYPDSRNRARAHARPCGADLAARRHRVDGMAERRADRWPDRRRTRRGRAGRRDRNPAGRAALIIYLFSSASRTRATTSGGVFDTSPTKV